MIMMTQPNTFFSGSSLLCRAKGWGVCLLFPLVLAACGAHSPNVLADRYKSIHISVFKNETLEFAVEERLTRDMIQTFERDGRLRVVPKSRADLEMDVRITKVDLSPIAFSDLDRAIGYNMNITIEADITDNSTGEMIMEGKPFSAFGTFLLNNSPTNTNTQNVSINLADQVRSYLLEGW
jgi:hypothetical protein